VVLFGNASEPAQEKRKYRLFFYFWPNKISLFMGLLSGKTALVTGASKGIGRSIAIRFALEGANVAFTFLSSVEKGQALEAELAAFGVKAKGYRSDASDFKAAEELVNAVVADFGGLDILVNNAGITRDNLLMRMTEESGTKS